MATPAVAQVRRPVMLSRLWLGGTLLLSLGSFAVSIAFAPAATEQPSRGLQWLLFVGSSVHVAATAWFYTVPDVRRHALANRQRYIVAPIGLVIGTAAVAALLTPGLFTWLLFGFFAWQFFHFQKQNLGMVALTGVSRGVGSAGRGERVAIVAAGIAGTVGILARPELLELTVELPDALRLLHSVAAAGFGLAVIAGLVALLRRPADRRPVTYTMVYAMSLLFFLPVFVFDSPYAAVAGLTIAHGYQYLLILGLIAGAAVPGRSSLISLAVLVNVALVGGLVLNAASQLHGAGPLGRAFYGAFLGIVMAHFVVDAGLWRLRDAFPRGFLTERLPYLLRPGSRAN